MRLSIYVCDVLEGWIFAGTPWGQLLACWAPARLLLNTVTLVCSLITDAKAGQTRAKLALVRSVSPTPANMILSRSFDKSVMSL